MLVDFSWYFVFFGRYNILIELHFSHSDTLVLFEEFQASDFLYTLRLERHEVLQVRGLPPECRKPKRCGQWNIRKLELFHGNLQLAGITLYCRRCFHWESREIREGGDTASSFKWYELSAAFLSHNSTWKCVKFPNLCTNSTHCVFSFKRDLRVLSFLLTRLKSSSPLQLDNGLVKTGEHIKDHQGHRSDWIKDHIKTTSRIIKALLEKQLLGWDMLRPSNYAEGRGWVGRMIDMITSMNFNHHPNEARNSFKE